MNNNVKNSVGRHEPPEDDIHFGIKDAGAGNVPQRRTGLKPNL